MDILPVFSVVPSHSAGLNRRGTQFLSDRSDNASVAACSANSRRLFQRQDLKRILVFVKSVLQKSHFFLDFSFRICFITTVCCSSASSFSKHDDISLDQLISCCRSSGRLMFRPPSLTGRENRRRSSSETSCLPVKAGINLFLINLFLINLFLSKL